MQFETARNKPVTGNRTPNRSTRSTPPVRPQSANIAGRNPIGSRSSTAQPAAHRSEPQTSRSVQSASAMSSLSTGGVPAMSSQSTRATPAATQQNAVQGWPSQQQAIKKLKRQIMNSLRRRFGASLPPQVLQQILNKVMKARLGSKRQQMTTPPNAPRQ